MLTLEEQLISEPLIWTAERRRLCADGAMVKAGEDGAWWVRSAEGVLIEGKAENLAAAMAQAEQNVDFSTEPWLRAFSSCWGLGNILLLQKGKSGWDCLLGEEDNPPTIHVGCASSANAAQHCLGFAVAAYRQLVKMSPGLSVKGWIQQEGAAGGPHEQWMRGVLAVIDTDGFSMDRQIHQAGRPS